MTGLSKLLSISIDFGTSHLFFPRIVIAFIVFMLIFKGIIQLIKHLKQHDLAESLKKFHFFEPDTDKAKLVGALVLIPLYFFAMDKIGGLFPNMGLGFLIASIPFMMVTSFLFVHNETSRHKKAAITIITTSVLVPLIVWLVFAKLLFITLP